MPWGGLISPKRNGPLCVKDKSKVKIRARLGNHFSSWKGGGQYWRTSEKYLPSDTEQGECWEQWPHEKYTHPLGKTDAVPEMNITILSYHEILQGQPVCKHEKTKNERNTVANRQNRLCCCYETSRPHIWIHVKKKESIWFFSLQSDICALACTVGGTYNTACYSISVRQPGLAFLSLFLCLSLAQKIGTMSHTYTKGPEDVSINYLHVAMPGTSTATWE